MESRMTAKERGKKSKQWRDWGERTHRRGQQCGDCRGGRGKFKGTIWYWKNIIKNKIYTKNTFETQLEENKPLSKKLRNVLNNFNKESIHDNKHVKRFNVIKQQGNTEATVTSYQIV